MNRGIVLALALGLSGLASAQQQQDGIDRLKVAFRDPSRPGTVKLSMMHGGITVKGHNGQEVIIEATPRRSSDSDNDRDQQRDGMRRIIAPNTNLSVEEENNNMRIDVHGLHRSVDVVLQVPMRTSLKLHTINRGNIVVENVQGDVEVNNINGSITLTNISGSAVAHALNGSLTATIRDVDPSKPMSFSSLNGKIDVTLPASVKANLNLQSERGEVFTDFDVVLASTPPKVEESKGESGRGRYRISTSRSMVGKVNGGGQEITFKNMNGSIYIRKAK